MSKYSIQVKGSVKIIKEGNTPQEAFAQVYNDAELYSVKDKTKANVIIELLDGKRKSVGYYVGQNTVKPRAEKKDKISKDTLDEEVVLAFCYAYTEVSYYLEFDADMLSITRPVCQAANLKFDVYTARDYINKGEYKGCLDEDAILNKVLKQSYTVLLLNKSDFIDKQIDSWTDNYVVNAFKDCVKGEKKAISKSHLYNSLNVIYKYISKNKFNKHTVKNLKEIILKIKGVDVDAINIGCLVGQIYYRHLRGFGILSNDVFTVGHQITSDERKEFDAYKGYSYVLHKDINELGAPEIALGALFKTENGQLKVKIIVERRGYIANQPCNVVSLVGTLCLLDNLTFNINENIEKLAKEIAEYFNRFVPTLYDLADRYQTLYSVKLYENPLEKIDYTDIGKHILDDEYLLDAAISRWTRIRGDKTEAQRAKVSRQGKTNFSILYKNNVSDYGHIFNPYVEYVDGVFTIGFVENGDMTKVVSSRKADMKGAIHQNSRVIASVLSGCLIDANYEDKHKI